MSDQPKQPLVGQSGRAQIRYRGRDRNGRGVTGVAACTAAELAENFFALGYRSLTISDASDEEVGGISKRADDGVRDWWGAR